MKKVEFRRNHYTESRGSLMSRKGIMLTAVLFFLLFFLFNYFSKDTEVKKLTFISVRVLNDSTFIVDSDTTNYDNFASVLIIAVKEHKDAEELRIHLPKDKTVGQLNDVIQIANAIEGVSLKMIADQ